MAAADGVDAEPLGYDEMLEHDGERAVFSALAKRGYRATPEVVLTVVPQLCAGDSEFHRDAFREWWVRAPINDVLMMKLAIQKLMNHPSLEFTLGLCARVMTDGPTPLLSVRELGIQAEPRLDGTRSSPPDSNDAEGLWLDLAFRATLQLLNERIEKCMVPNMAMRALARGVSPSVLVLAAVSTWIDRTEGVRAAFQTVLEQMWARWADGDNFGRVPVSYIDDVLALSRMLLPVLRRNKVRSNFPVMFWLRVVAGETAVKSIEMRKRLLNTFAMVDWSDGIGVDRIQTEPDTLRLACQALAELPGVAENDRTWLTIAVQTIVPIVSYNLAAPDDPPLLYERAMVNVLGMIGYGVAAAETNADVNLMFLGSTAMSAIHLMERITDQFPERNILEAAFWALTARFVQITRPATPFDVPLVLRYQLGRVIGTPGHRAFVAAMWSLCTDEEYAAWRAVLGAPGARPTPEAEHVVDPISSNKVLRLVRFSPDDKSGGVGVETFVNHVVSSGLINPFTNEVIVWKGVIDANPDWELRLR